MADDQSQRPYRSNVPPARGASGPATPSGNDPLAELARLIGQNDPFSEFGRAAAPQQPEPEPDWPPAHDAAPAAGYPPQPPEPAVPPFTDQPQFSAADFGRQPYGNDLYQTDPEASGYGAPGYPPETGVPGYPPAPGEGGYEHPPFPAGHGELGLEDDEYYDDVPPNRRRLGIVAIAGVFALAVLGTAGAFGYRAIFGSSSPASPPPVIKAETAPSKIVPATAGNDAQANKMITDRVNERGQGEKLVSREEQPIDVNAGKPANIVFPPSQDGAMPSGAASSGSMASNALPQLGSGVVGTGPKRIRTIAIRPDQSPGAAAATESAPEAAPEAAPAPVVTPPPPRVVNITPARPATPPPRAAAPAQRPAITRAEPQPSANAPLSLNPNALAQPAPAPTAQRSAAVAPPTRLAPQATSGASGSYVQLSSQRSEAEAQAAFRSLQAKYPNQLGGRQLAIRRADLGAKGIYFRATVGPFGSSSEASEMCASLKAAGGDCFVLRN
ncbi:MAG: SPOR domain-containing protein [Pseudolabrys sp.]|nr:SPOR domain-containing protein [Pseudolabrys sp.]